MGRETRLAAIPWPAPPYTIAYKCWPVQDTVPRPQAFQEGNPQDANSPRYPGLESVTPYWSLPQDREGASEERELLQPLPELLGFVLFIWESRTRFQDP